MTLQNPFTNKGLAASSGGAHFLARCLLVASREKTSR